MERWISFFGLFAMMFLAWLMSSNKKNLNLRVIVGALGLQVALALFVFKTDAGEYVFDKFGDGIDFLLAQVDAGSSFVFGSLTTEPSNPNIPVGISRSTPWRAATGPG